MLSARILEHLAVHDADGSLRPFCDIQVMCDHHNGIAYFMQLYEQPQHLRAAAVIPAMICFADVLSENGGSFPEPKASASEHKMKATGIVRRIDDLGRVVIPKEIRRTMRIREGDPSLKTLTQEIAFCSGMHELIGRGYIG